MKTTAEEKLEWLKGCAEKMREMEFERIEAFRNNDSHKAFQLLKGIKFARSEFYRVSQLLKKQKQNDKARNNKVPQTGNK